MILTLILLTLSVVGNVYLITRHSERDAVIRTAIRKAESDRCAMVRIPYNQLAKLMGWRPEFTHYTNRFTGERGVYQSSVYPIKEGR